MRSEFALSPFWTRNRLRTGWRRAGRWEDVDEALEALEEDPGAAGRRSADLATLETPEGAVKGAEGVVEGESAARPRPEAHELLEKDLEKRARGGKNGEGAEWPDEPLEALLRVFDDEELVEASDPHLHRSAFAEEDVDAFQEVEAMGELRPLHLQPLNTPV